MIKSSIKKRVTCLFLLLLFSPLVYDSSFLPGVFDSVAPLPLISHLISSHPLSNPALWNLSFFFIPIAPILILSLPSLSCIMDMRPVSLLTIYLCVQLPNALNSGSDLGAAKINLHPHWQFGYFIQASLPHV